MSWLPDELKQEVREVFEPRYGHDLDEEEIVEIAENLSNFMESFLKFRWKKNEENKKD